MQAIGDIISYFFSYYFNCQAKKCTKIQLGENIWYFFSHCLYFFPLRPCNNCSTLTDCVLGGVYCKREIKSYFSRWTHSTQSFYVTVSELSISTGGKYMIFFPLCLYFCPCVFIFSPCVFIFSLLGHASNCSTFAGGVRGKNILCLCFPPCKKIIGGRKMVFFPISIFFRHGPCCIWFPFSDSENDDIYPWLKCTFFCL